MSGSPQQPQYQSLYRACIKDAATAGADLMQATLERALRELPAMAARIDDVVDRNLLLDAAGVLSEQQQVLVDAFPQALLAEFAQAIAGGRSSAFSFDSLPLLGDEQLQENADLVRGAQELEAAVRPELAQLEAMLAASHLTPRAASSATRCARRSTCAASIAWSGKARYRRPVRRRWLRHLPPLMAPDLADAYAAMAARLQAGAALTPDIDLDAPEPQEAAGPRHPAHHPRAAQAAGRGTRGGRGRARDRFQRERVLAHRARGAGNGAGHAQGRPAAAATAPAAGRHARPGARQHGGLPRGAAPGGQASRAGRWGWRSCTS